MPINFAIEK